MKAFKYRTTLVARYDGKEIVWNDVEFFKCAEEWKKRKKIPIDLVEDKAVTIIILERKSLGLEEYGEYDFTAKKRKEMEKEQAADVEMNQPSESSGAKKTVEELEEENKLTM